MKEKALTKAERNALRERLAKRTRDEMAREREDPARRAEHEAWLREYDAEVAMAEARRKANITQAELARRMRTPRANVRRIESGQNITLATLARYLHGCGFDFKLRIFPLRKVRRVAALA